jgi:hypothetical protein
MLVTTIEFERKTVTYIYSASQANFVGHCLPSHHIFIVMLLGNLAIHNSLL